MALDSLTDKTVDGESAESNVTSPATAGNEVIDLLGRPLRDLRISVTDRCNFRCPYCMPRERFGEDHTFLPRRAFLTFDEIEKVVRACMELGLEKVRITGGEPLLRPGLDDLMGRLSNLGLDLALKIELPGAVVALILFRPGQNMPADVDHDHLGRVEPLDGARYQM